MRFVYFDGMTSYSNEEMAKAYGYKPDAARILTERGAFNGYHQRFEKTFLSNIVAGETYIFIIVTPEGLYDPRYFAAHEKFQNYLKTFAMEPYLYYKSPQVFMNRNVDKSKPRLMLYAFKFDEKYVEFAKGFVK